MASVPDQEAAESMADTAGAFAEGLKDQLEDQLGPDGGAGLLADLSRWFQSPLLLTILAGLLVMATIYSTNAETEQNRRKRLRKEKAAEKKAESKQVDNFLDDFMKRGPAAVRPSPSAGAAGTSVQPGSQQPGPARSPEAAAAAAVAAARVSAATAAAAAAAGGGNGASAAGGGEVQKEKVPVDPAVAAAAAEKAAALAAAKTEAEKAKPRLRWTQTKDEVDVLFRIEEDVTKGEVKTSFSTKSVSLRVQDKIILQGDLWDGVDPDGCTWQFSTEGGCKYVWLQFEKDTPGKLWKGLLKGGPTIPKPPGAP